MMAQDEKMLCYFVETHDHPLFVSGLLDAKYCVSTGGQSINIHNVLTAYSPTETSTSYALRLPFSLSCRESWPFVSWKCRSAPLPQLV